MAGLRLCWLQTVQGWRNETTPEPKLGSRNINIVWRISEFFFVLSGLIQDGKFFFEIGAVRYFSVSAALVFKVARSYEIDLKLSFSA